MKIILPILYAIIIYGFTHQNTSGYSTKLICELTTDRPEYMLGEVPKLEVRIKNISDENVYIIGALDKSNTKMRMPHCYFSIEKPKPDTVKFGGCGFQNPLRVLDFKMIKPGETFNPYQQIDMYGYFPDYPITQKETFRNPGVYKVQFHYSTNSTNINNFIGSVSSLSSLKDSAQLKLLFALVPKIELVSNEILIKVKDEIVAKH